MKSLLLVGLAAAFASNLVDVASAQSTSHIPRIGFLSASFPASAGSKALRQALRELGYIEGTNVLIEERYSDTDVARLPPLAEELVRLKVDVIVTNGIDPSLSAKRATQKIPIIMAGGNDPVAAGLVASLGRPGGNITGLATASGALGKKRLELLKEIVPDNSLVAVLGGRGRSIALQSQVKDLEAAAHALRLRLQTIYVQGPTDFERAFSEIDKGGAGSLVVVSGWQGNASYVRRIVDLATKRRLPAIYPDSDYVDAGGLISYGTNLQENYRRAAYYVDRILKGAKPADMPVEMPTKFEMVVNLKTAKELGLTIPQSALAQADRVIQ